MTYIDLAKLFNVDAVTYNIFIREFYPFGTGEPLVVRTHKALRPTNIKQGTHVPDPNHELWKKYFAKLTKQTLAVKPIITQSNTRENKLNLVAWDNPVPLDVWYHANRKDLYKRGREKFLRDLAVVDVARPYPPFKTYGTHAGGAKDSSVWQQRFRAKAASPFAYSLCRVVMSG